MLRINNRGFKRSYVYGGAGIFDSIAKAAVNLVQKGALQVGKTLGEKGVQKVSSLVSRSRDKPLNSEDIDVSTFPPDPERPSVLTSKSQDILRRYTAPPPPPGDNFNLNALIDGSAIRIEDYIKRWK